MSINSISFGNVVKITGNMPLASAQRAVDFLNKVKNPEKSESEAINKLTLLFPVCDAFEKAQAITIDDGNSAYILTGEESYQIESLRMEKEDQISIVSVIYGEDSDMTAMVTEKETEIFKKLAKKVISTKKVRSVFIWFDSEKDKIKSFDVIN